MLEEGEVRGEGLLAASGRRFWLSLGVPKSGEILCPPEVRPSAFYCLFSVSSGFAGALQLGCRLSSWPRRTVLLPVLAPLDSLEPIATATRLVCRPSPTGGRTP